MSNSETGINVRFGDRLKLTLSRGATSQEKYQTEIDDFLAYKQLTSEPSKRKPKISLVTTANPRLALKSQKKSFRYSTNFVRRTSSKEGEQRFPIHAQIRKHTLSPIMR